MPRVIVTARAVHGLRRCREFLLAVDARAARRAADVIGQQFTLLETMPEVGRPVPGRPGLRELIIRFGGSGYVALYLHDSAKDLVHVLAFRHQKEAGY